MVAGEACGPSTKKEYIMAITPTVIKGERREEFGKGSARRLRRDWGAHAAGPMK